MNITLSLEPHDTLAVRLVEGAEHATIAVRPARAGIRSLQRALRAALAEGYGECFWPAMPTGQYWWIFKRDGDALETVAMWTRGGAALWEHTFRATDGAAWVEQRLEEEAARLGL